MQGTQRLEFQHRMLVFHRTPTKIMRKKRRNALYLLNI